MLKSMTGFGRSEKTDGKRKIIVEIKSVNHRYLDTNIKIPKKLNCFEAGVRVCLKNYIQRGKIDIYIVYEDLTENTICLKYNEGLAREYIAYAKEIAQQFDIKNDVTVKEIMGYPEVFTMEEKTIDEDSLWILLEQAIMEALEKLIETRIQEGENLKRDLCQKLDNMLSHVLYVEERSPEILLEYREKLENKVKELLHGSDLEEDRIMTEVTLYADKICVDEEVVRLKSHIENMRAALLEGNGVGRKLDFLAQEMNREANTILSKSNDLAITNRAIDLKTEIEKVREQIQNIE